MENTIIFEKATFWVNDLGILFCKFNNIDTSHKLKEDRVLEYINAIVKLTNGKPIPKVIDIRDCRGTFEIDAVKLFSKKLKMLKLHTIEAYVVNSLAIKLLVLSYKRVYDPNSTYKIFNTMEEAIDFCKPQI